MNIILYCHIFVLVQDFITVFFSDSCNVIAVAKLYCVFQVNRNTRLRLASPLDYVCDFHVR